MSLIISESSSQRSQQPRTERENAAGNEYHSAARMPPAKPIGDRSPKRVAGIRRESHSAPDPIVGRSNLEAGSRMSRPRSKGVEKVRAMHIHTSSRSLFVSKRRSQCRITNRSPRRRFGGPSGERPAAETIPETTTRRMRAPAEW